MFVKNATGVLKKVLVCPPAYLKKQPINGIANATLAKALRQDHDTVMEEYATLVQAYKENGVEVVEIEADPAMPMMVYARDFGACVAEGAIMGRFKEPCRQGESIIYEEKLKELGVPIIARCSAGTFEGGDFWFLDDYTLAFGVADRTTWQAVTNLREQLDKYGYVVMGVGLAPENMHLDMAFNVVAEKVAVAAVAELPYNFVKLLKKRNFHIIEVPSEAVFQYGCNVQGIGNGKVMTVKQNKSVNDQMKALGLTLIELEIEEILRTGGGPHCMTFPLVRE